MKSRVLQIGLCVCESAVTVGAEGVYYKMPSPAGKGDREAVDEESILDDRK